MCVLIGCVCLRKSLISLQSFGENDYFFPGLKSYRLNMQSVWQNVVPMTFKSQRDTLIRSIIHLLMDYWQSVDWTKQLTVFTPLLKDYFLKFFKFIFCQLVIKCNNILLVTALLQILSFYRADSLMHDGESRVLHNDGSPVRYSGDRKVNKWGEIECVTSPNEV